MEFLMSAMMAAAGAAPRMDVWVLLKPLMVVLVPVMVLVVAAKLALLWLGRGDVGRAIQFRRRPGVLTAAERSFYGVLQSVADEEWVVAFKVRLADLIEVAGERGPRWWKGFNQICSKHADFVICGAADLAPLLVIELDDASHGRRDSSTRDEVKDQALKSAGIPVRTET